MELKNWKFHGITIAVIRIMEGLLVCTSKALCAALGLTQGQLDILYSRHIDQLNPLRPTDCVSKNDLMAFLKANRIELGIGRVRTDMLLWPIREAIKVAYLAHTKVSWDFINASIDLVLQESRENAITQEEYHKLESHLSLVQKEGSNLRARLARLEEIVEYIKPTMEVMASASGTTLQAHKRVKDWGGN